MKGFKGHHHKTEHQVFDKYDLYTKAVQSPETDVEFVESTYSELRAGKKPESLREDFCGTFALSCEWIKMKKQHKAFGVDLDPEPMSYGKLNHFQNLTNEQRQRLNLIEGDVLEIELPKVDVAMAVNFSYFLFKKRELLKKYFKRVHDSLKEKGIFIIDVFGGSQCHDEIEDKIVHKGFTYYWDQTGFDPVTNEGVFHIHFKLGHGKKIERVFTYDWRLWTIPELRDILEEVGFSKTHVYWEGTNSKGGGNGVFTRTEKGEPCLSWIAYIVSEK